MRPAMDMVGPYCHPLHVQSFADSCCLLTMLTMREAGAAASALKHAEDDDEASDVGINDLGDGGPAMRALRRSQPWESEQAAPPALVWFWRLEEDRTEETWKTVKAAGVLNNLN